MAKHQLMTLIPLLWEAFNSPNLGNSKKVPLGIASCWDRPDYDL